MKNFKMNLTKQKALDCGLSIEKNDVEISVSFNVERVIKFDKFKGLICEIDSILTKNGQEIETGNGNDWALEDVVEEIIISTEGWFKHQTNGYVIRNCKFRNIGFNRFVVVYVKKYIYRYIGEK